MIRKSPESVHQGQSLLNPEELSLDWEKVSALYKRLVELVGKREDGRRQAEGLLKAIEEKRKRNSRSDEGGPGIQL